MIQPEDLVDPVINGIDMKNHPDFSDAYLDDALVNQNGALRSLNQSELDDFNENYAEWIHKYIFENQLYL